jgi:ribosomal protein S18 acetylase RimI-like enzyme
MSVYTLRPASLRDAKAIAEIHAAAVRAAYAGLVPDEHLQSINADKRQGYWREAIEFSEPQVHVALDGDKLVGFVGYDRSRDKGTRNTVGEIWSIYALPDQWSKGVGVALWDSAREGLLEEGCTEVTVWVPLRNERAIRFHELAGFKREMNTAKTVPIGNFKIEEVRLRRSLVS